MKKLLVLLVGFMGLVFLAGCATSLPKTGFLGQYAEKLEPGPEGGAKMRWLKPGVDWAKYNKFMVDYVVFALSPDSEYKGIDGDEMKKLGDSASKAIVDAIKAKYPVVAEPGPDVVRLRFAIVNLKQSYPVLSGITSVVPIGLGISIIKKGATGAWTGSGATEAELLTLDSQTNEVIAAAYDEYTAGFTERFTKWGSVDDAFKYWGERVVEFADNVKGKK
jgi:hypothetical protein